MIYAHFRVLVKSGGATLVKNANHLVDLSEEAISAFLIAYLNKPGLRVTQETHSKGHVDITIEAEHTPPVRRRLGEAKIYRGPAYHVSGLEQLIARYTTGREGSGIVVEYVKKPDIKGLVIKIKAHIDENKQPITNTVAENSCACST
jgi:hypothetical protein